MNSDFLYTDWPYTCTSGVSGFSVGYISNVPGAPPSIVAETNLIRWGSEQCVNIYDNQTAAALQWLHELLKSTLANDGLTVTSYMLWIALLVEHLAEMTIANVMKEVGSSIEWSVQSITDACNLIMGYVNQAMAGTLHLINGPLDSIIFMKIFGYVVGYIKTIGSYIEQIGVFLHDVTDMLGELKEISFAIASLGAMVAQITVLLDDIFKRINAVILNGNKNCAGVTVKYAEQAANAKAIREGLQNFNSKIQPTINSSMFLLLTATKHPLSATNTGIQLA